MPIKKEKLDSIKGYAYKKQSETTDSASHSAATSTQKMATLKKDKQEQLYSSSTKSQSNAKTSQSSTSSGNQSGVGRKQVLESRIDSGTAKNSDYQSLLKLAEAGINNAEKGKAAAQSNAEALMSRGNVSQGEFDAAKDALKSANKRVSDWEEYRDSTAKGAYYGSLAQNADYGEKSKYSPSGNIQDVQTRVNPSTMEVYRTGSGVDDLYYRAINGDAEALKLMPEAKKSESLVQSYLGDGENLSHMTEDEIARFNYLYSQGEASGDTSHKDAWSYIEYLSPTLNKRQRELAQEQATEFAEEHPIASSLASAAMSIPKGASYIGQMLDYIGNGKVDQNANYNRFSYVPTDIRSEVGQNVATSATEWATDKAVELFGEEKGIKFAQAWGEGASTFYGIGMSMLDNIVQIATSTALGGAAGLGKAGIQNIALGIMSTGAAADVARESLDSGEDYTRAMTLSTVAGMIEALTEKMGLDALFDTALRGKSVFTYLAKTSLSEGAEEGASDIFNWIADDVYDLVSGQTQSEWKQQIAEYMANGSSESEAFGLALAARAKELGLDVFAGFVSGAGLSSLSVAKFGYDTVKASRVTGKAINATNQTQTIIDSGLQQPEGSKAYKLAQQLQQKTATGQNISNSEIGKLNLEIRRAQYSAQQETQLSDFTAKLTESGLDEKASKGLAQSMQMTLNGEEITGGAATRIAQNPTAVSLLQEASGVTINTDAPIAQVKAQIRSIAALAKAQQIEAEKAQKSVSKETNEITPVTEENATAPLTDENTAQLTSEEAADNSEYTAGRSEAAARADRAYMRRAGAIFGENGARAINTAYDSAVAAQYSADDVIKAFSKVYNAVLKGEAEPQVDISESVKAAARGAAELDAQRASEAQSYRNGGLVKDESYRKAHLSKAQEKLLDGIGRALHARVRIADNVVDENGNSVNGRYVNGELTVSLKSNDPLLTTAIHEAVHRIREVSPESYQELAAFVRDALGDRHFATALDVYAQAYDGDESFVSEEIVADAMGRVLSDESAVQRFTELHQELARKLRDVFADIVNAIKRAVKRQNTELTETQRNNMRGVYERMDEAVRLFDKALERVAEKQSLQSGEQNGKIGETRYSLKEDLENVRKRKEEKADFDRRCRASGLKVVEGKETLYGFKYVEGKYAKEGARLVQEELKKLGVKSYIIDGRMSYNRNGVTVERTVPQAAASGNDFAFISNEVETSNVETAGHEAYHFWKNTTAREHYTDILADNIRLNSNSFLEFQSEIAETYFGKEVDLADRQQLDNLFEEVCAYISGYIHEGKKDDALKDILRDVDAVRAAWNELVEANKGNGQSKPRHSKTTAGMEERLSEELAKQTETDAFKRWFGKSEVVNDDGTPRVVYHATNSAFTIFDRDKLGKHTFGNASSWEIAATSLIGHWFSDHDVRNN